MEAFGLGPRFVVPALAGPGLTLGALLTAKPGPAKAGTTNEIHEERSRQSKLDTAPGRWHVWCRYRTFPCRMKTLILLIGLAAGPLAAAADDPTPNQSPSTSAAVIT